MMDNPSTGTILKGISGLYYAQDAQGGRHVLRAKGIFRRMGITPLVGDQIRFFPPAGEDHGWIEEVLPRLNELIRPPVANIRHLIFVLAPEPEPDLMLLDTILVMARQQNIDPVIVLNKCELAPDMGADLRAQYRATGVPVLTVSALQRIGLDALEAILLDGICCFAGQSGVGKSALVSAVTGIQLLSGEMSHKIARGKNTTRHAELFVRDGFQVLDTAGFSLLLLLSHLEPIRLKDSYPEFTPYESACRFQPCYHDSEPDCAVLAAMREGKLPIARMERYHALLAKTRETWRNRYA